MNTFWLFFSSDYHHNICAHFFPPNGRKHQVSAVVKTCYYAYFYCVGPPADVNMKYNAFQNVHISIRQNKELFLFGPDGS